eukprot:1147585-Pelagomonas_calceolata.AAC.4
MAYLETYCRAGASTPPADLQDPICCTSVGPLTALTTAFAAASAWTSLQPLPSLPQPSLPALPLLEMPLSLPGMSSPALLEHCCAWCAITASTANSVTLGEY